MAERKMQLQDFFKQEEITAMAEYFTECMVNKVDPLPHILANWCEPNVDMWRIKFAMTIPPAKIAESICATFAAMYMKSLEQAEGAGTGPRGESPPLPRSWELLEERPDGYAFRHRDGMIVVMSWSYEDDDRMWLHVSASHKTRVPTYEELVEVKHLFIGPDKAAIQVFPERDKHININKQTLHLWSCILEPGQQPPLPDFTRGMGQL